MNRVTKQTLSLFVEKAFLLRRRGFWQFYEQGGEIGFSFSLDANSGLLRDVAFMGQNEELRDALLLSLRLFIQDNERISLRNMAQLSLLDAGLSPTWTAGFAQLHTEFNRLLDDPIEGMGQAAGVPGLTRRKVLDTFLYGEFAHTNPIKRARYRAWRRLPTFPLIEFIFSATVSGLVCLILNSAELAVAELSK